MDKKRIIEGIAEWADSEPLVRKAYLYGSWVKGTVKESSDIDVAIQLNPHAGDTYAGAGQQWDMDELRSRLQPLLPYPLQLDYYDPVVTEKVHKGVTEASILIYDQEAGGGAP